MQSQSDFLSVADALVTLYRRKFSFILAFVGIMGLATTYALVSKKTYELTGTFCVGRFMGDLLEDGEFVAQKLEDYSFIKNALDESGVQLDISVSRMQKLIKTEVVNEVKKTQDVGLVQLNVKYKDQQKVKEIFEALAKRLIQDHQVLLDQSVAVLKSQEQEYVNMMEKNLASLERDEELSRSNTSNPGDKSAPSLLLLEHTISEKRAFTSMLNKDLHEVRVDAQAATTSFNTRLADAPQVPDAHIKPKLMLTIILGFIMASIFGVCAAFFSELFFAQVLPKLRS